MLAMGQRWRQPALGEAMRSDDAQLGMAALLWLQVRAGHMLKMPPLSLNRSALQHPILEV